MQVLQISSESSQGHSYFQPQRVDLSPPLQIDKVSIPGGKLSIVRDDVLKGGTKQRATAPFIQKKITEGYSHFVYASPFCGFAQVALAVTCQALGAACTVYCEEDRSSDSPRQAHEFAKLAVKYGAEVVIVSDLQEAELRSQEHVHGKVGHYKIPLGFNCLEYKNFLRKEIQRHWKTLKANLGADLGDLWLPVGSGTLINSFRDVLPENTLINGVDVHVLDSQDSRIESLSDREGIRMHSCSQKFIEKAAHAPPIPSNIHYDAKLWNFIVSQGKNGDVWWNVAR